MTEALMEAKTYAKTSTRRRIAVYCDGAVIADMVAAYRTGTADGFTTNPTLMAKAGITDYKKFAKEAIAAIPDRSISFEVFADEFGEMGRQAREIASWGKNVFVKVPITNTRGDSAIPLIHELSHEGIKLNVTALMTPGQVRETASAISRTTPTIISVFAGRVADTGVDPVPLMQECVRACSHLPHVELLWASPREVLNVYQAEECGCHIITCTPDLIKKLALRDKNLLDYSRETVQMFFDDGRKAGFRL
jgi:transaldolase